MSNKQIIKKVVGLKYDLNSMAVPEVLLKGIGIQAEVALEEARNIEQGPIIVEDEALLDQLYQLPIDAAIGHELYEVIAILLIHLYGLDKVFAEQKMQG